MKLHMKIRSATHAGVNGGSSKGGGAGGEKRPNGSDTGSMSLTGGGPGSGIASRTGGRSGNGSGSHTATGGISGGSWTGWSTAGSRGSSTPDAKRFLRLYSVQHSRTVCKPHWIIKHSQCFQKHFITELKAADSVSLSLSFNGHFSKWTWVSQYQNVSTLNFTGAKDNGGGGDN